MGVNILRSDASEEEGGGDSCGHGVRSADTQTYLECEVWENPSRRKSASDGSLSCAQRARATVTEKDGARRDL